MKNAGVLPGFYQNKRSIRASKMTQSVDKTLQQIYTFRNLASQYGLSCRDPYHFFNDFFDRFEKANDMSEDECADGVLLLLLYWHLGSMVFITAFHVPFGELLMQISWQDTEDEKWDVLRGGGRFSVLRPNIHKLHVDFRELEQQERWNREFVNLRASITPSMLEIKQETGSVSVTKATALFSCFQGYRQKKSLKYKQEQANICGAEEALRFYSEISKIETEYLAKRQEVLKVSLLQEYLDRFLTNLLKLSPVGVDAVPEVYERLYFYEGSKSGERDMDVSDPYRKAPRYGYLLEYQAVSKDAHSEKEWCRAETDFLYLLGERKKIPAYRFFASLLDTLEQNPPLHEIAPTFLWYVIYSRSTSVFAKRTSGFNAEKLLGEFNKAVLSGERKSAALQKADYILYDEVHQFVKTQYPEMPVNKSMCEFLFQRVVHTQINCVSNTSIIGDTLKKADPLFRGFILMYDAIRHAMDGYASCLPYLEEYRITREQADLFYQGESEVKKGYEIIRYLEEQKESIPIHAKKRLNADKCTEIAEVSFQIGAEENGYAGLEKTIREFIRQHPRLEEYAKIDKTHEGYVHSAVYRHGLERKAWFLADAFLSRCADLIYYPLSTKSVNRIWEQIGTVLTVGSNVYIGDRKIQKERFLRMHLDKLSNPRLAPLAVKRYGSDYAGVILSGQKLQEYGAFSPSDRPPVFLEVDKVKLEQESDVLVNGWLTVKEEEREERLTDVKNNMKYTANLQIYHISKVKADGIAMCVDLDAVCCNIGKLVPLADCTSFEAFYEKDFEIYDLCTYLYTELVSEIRKETPDYFPIIAEVYSRNWTRPFITSMMKVLTLALYDSGASAIMLTGDAAQRKEVFALAKRRGKELLIPVLCSPLTANHSCKGTCVSGLLFEMYFE